MNIPPVRSGFKAVHTLREDMLFRLLFGDADTLEQRNATRHALRNGRIDRPGGTWRRVYPAPRWQFTPTQTEADNAEKP